MKYNSTLQKNYYIYMLKSKIKILILKVRLYKDYLGVVHFTRSRFILWLKNYYNKIYI